MPNGGCCWCWLALGLRRTFGAVSIRGGSPGLTNNNSNKNSNNDGPPLRHMVTATSPCDLPCTAYFLPNDFPNVLLPYIV